MVVDYGFIFNDYKVVKDTVKSADNLKSILDRYNLPDSLTSANAIQKIKDSFPPRNLRFKKPYFVFLDKKAPHAVTALVFTKDLVNYSLINLKDSVYANNLKKPTKVKRRTVAGEIKGSLSSTLKELGLQSSIASKLAKRYAYTIDFFKFKRGDKFAITVTERYLEDTIFIKLETIEATYFEQKDKGYYAFPYKTENQKEEEYYDENGKGLKNMFLKAPLDYFRISSKFSRSRFHPVQLRWKAHNGTDYAAPHGTPIKATASGIVEQAGYTAGNGNFVRIKHNKTYSTQYLHMSKILVKRKQKVAQGQIIGKVGSTGLATGPHVCYRFWKNGVQVDPLRLKLPNVEPMEGEEKKKFNNYISPLKKELDNALSEKFND